MDALSQIEKEHSFDETGGFTEAGMSQFELKSNKLMEETNLDLTGHAQLLNQSKNFAAGTGIEHTNMPANFGNVAV